MHIKKRITSLKSITHFQIILIHIYKDAICTVVVLIRSELHGSVEWSPFFFWQIRVFRFFQVFDYFFSDVYSLFISHALDYNILIIGRNPMEVASKCWQEVSNLKSHEYHKILRIAKPTLHDCPQNFWVLLNIMTCLLVKFLKFQFLGFFIFLGRNVFT